MSLNQISAMALLGNTTLSNCILTDRGIDVKNMGGWGVKVVHLIEQIAKIVWNKVICSKGRPRVKGL